MAAAPEVKADYLNAERRWLALARSYQFTASLGDFSTLPDIRK
jgi:hypothetical protein